MKRGQSARDPHASRSAVSTEDGVVPGLWQDPPPRSREWLKLTPFRRSRLERELARRLVKLGQRTPSKNE